MSNPFAGQIALVDKLEARMSERYAAWENGSTTSPSARDFALDALEICGMDTDVPDPLADYLDDAMTGGCDGRALAMLAVGWIDRETAE